MAVDHATQGAALADAGSVSILNSSFTSDGPTSIVAGSGIVTAGVSIVAASADVESNTFASTAGPGALDVMTVSTPIVRNNTVSNSGTLAGTSCTTSWCVPTVQVISPALDLNLLTGNQGSGNHEASFSVGGTLAASGSFASLPSSWTALVLGGQYGDLSIPTGITLTIPAGTVVKFPGGGIKVLGGTLNAPGTGAAPVVLTSIHDAAAGGATDTSKSPAVGDWPGVTVSGGGQFTLASTHISYAATGVAVSDGSGVLTDTDIEHVALGVHVDAGKVGVRGKIANATMGITACTLESGACAVDAAYTNWGSSAGPFPVSGALVCGAVTASPWLPVGPGQTRSIFSADCDGSDPGRRARDGSPVDRPGSRHRLRRRLRRDLRVRPVRETCGNNAWAIAGQSTPFTPAAISSTGYKGAADSDGRRGGLRHRGEREPGDQRPRRLRRDRVRYRQCRLVPGRSDRSRDELPHRARPVLRGEPAAVRRQAGSGASRPPSGHAA